MKSLGEPNTRSRLLSIKLGNDIEAKVAEWIAKQPKPPPTLSLAIRRLLEHALADGGPKGQHTAEQKIVIVEHVIKNTPIPNKCTPARGVAKGALAGLEVKQAEPLVSGRRPAGAMSTEARPIKGKKGGKA